MLVSKEVYCSFCWLCSGGGSRRNHFNLLLSEIRQFTMFPLRLTWSISEKEIISSKCACMCTV